MPIIANKEDYQYYKARVRKLQSLCKPLNEYLGIPHFGYLRVSITNNDYFYFSNNDSVTEHYLEQVSQSNIFFEKYIRHSYDKGYTAILWPCNPDVGNQSMQVYNYNGLWNGISFIKKTDNEIELWWFATNKDNQNINDFYIRNIDILESFIDYFQAQSAKILGKNKDMPIGKYQAFDFTLPNFDNLQNEKIKVNEFISSIRSCGLELKINGTFVHFTKRQFQCLDLLSHGLTIKSIAKELSLSPRTIETYVNTIKEKSGYHYKSDLIKFYKDKG